jgi:hypothetical protein
MAKVRKRTWTNKEGKQTAWIADYTDQAGDRHIKTFPTQKAAKTWLVETQKEIKQGINTAASSSATIAEAGEEWITQAETDGLEASPGLILVSTPPTHSRRLSVA